MFELIYNGLKRILYGATSVFTVKSGSGAFNGASFVSIYKERTKTPVKIVGVQFQCSPDAQGAWQICVNGEKCFPFSDVNNLDSEYHNLMEISVAAGELLTLEVRSRNAQQKSVVILEELNVIEMR